MSHSGWTGLRCRKIRRNGCAGRCVGQLLLRPRTTSNLTGLQRPEDPDHQEVPGPLGDVGNWSKCSQGVAEAIQRWWGLASQGLERNVCPEYRQLRQEEPNSTAWSIQLCDEFCDGEAQRQDHLARVFGPERPRSFHWSHSRSIQPESNGPARAFDLATVAVGPYRPPERPKSDGSSWYAKPPQKLKLLTRLSLQDPPLQGLAPTKQRPDTLHSNSRLPRP